MCVRVKCVSHSVSHSVVCRIVCLIVCLIVCHSVSYRVSHRVKWSCRRCCTHSACFKIIIIIIIITFIITFIYRFGLQYNITREDSFTTRLLTSLTLLSLNSPFPFPPFSSAQQPCSPATLPFSHNSTSSAHHPPALRWRLLWFLTWINLISFLFQASWNPPPTLSSSPSPPGTLNPPSPPLPPPP